MKDLVFNNNGQIVTNSLLVAQKFGKDHKHVMRDIDELIKGVSKIGHTPEKGLAEKSATLFIPSEYVHPQNKQTYRMYIMNRDGFSLLVMGFTGKDALKFKIDFIEAFNKYEKIALQKPLSQVEIVAQSAQLLLENSRKLSDHNRRIEQLEAKTATYKVDYYTVAGYGTLQGMKISLPLASSLGRKATKLCKERGLEIDKVNCPRFGLVNMYPTEILEEVFEISIVN